MSSGESDRHGGPEHKYWSKVLADQLRAHGYEVTEECPIGGGKTIDLVASRNDHKIAFEIETGNSDAAANVQKCLEAGADEVVVVATSAHARDALLRRFSTRPDVDVITGREATRWLAEQPCSAMEGPRYSRPI